MHILVYIVAALFILLATGLLFVYYRERDTRTLLMAIAYGAAAAAALAYMNWWPLVLGFLLVWLLKLLGFEPGSGRASRQ